MNGCFRSSNPSFVGAPCSSHLYWRREANEAKRGGQAFRLESHDPWCQRSDRYRREAESGTRSHRQYEPLGKRYLLRYFGRLTKRGWANVNALTRLTPPSSPTYPTHELTAVELEET